MMNHLFFTEKYRPNKISDCILPSNIKADFQAFADSGNPPNMLLSGNPGTGKTTIAKALCDELGWDYIVINGATDGNIDTLRTDILNFCSSMSLRGIRKCVILDEADGLTRQMQEGLKSFIEEYSTNASFILTCNNKNKIIGPIRDSRMSNIDFIFPKLNSSNKEAMGLIAKFYKKSIEILTKENVNFDEEVVLEIVKRYYPDFRRTLNELQRHSRTGVLNTSALSQLVDADISELVKYLKDKDFTAVRQWVGKNIDNDQVQIMYSLYKEIEGLIEPKELAQAILIIGKYTYQAAFVADSEINLTACFVELMIDCF